MSIYKYPSKISNGNIINVSIRNSITNFNKTIYKLTKWSVVWFTCLISILTDVVLLKYVKLLIPREFESRSSENVVIVPMIVLTRLVNSTMAYVLRSMLSIDYRCIRWSIISFISCYSDNVIPLVNHFNLRFCMLITGVFDTNIKYYV
jgi:hypothetical protein